MHKRKRTENWSASDKRLLRELCAERLNIIENKCVDTEHNRQKRECWSQITDEFNILSEIKRDVSRIQIQWRCMKMKAKAEEFSCQNDINKTHDNPPPQLLSKLDRELVSNKIDNNILDPYGIGIKIKEENDSIDPLDNSIDEYRDNGFSKDHNESNATAINSYSQSPVKRISKKKKIAFVRKDSEASQKKELFELTRAHMIEEHEERMAVLELEKQCRQKELERIQLEIERLKKK